jgi:hypothetical protein
MLISLGLGRLGSVLGWVDWDQSLFFIGGRNRKKKDTIRKKDIVLIPAYKDVKCWLSFFGRLFSSYLLSVCHYVCTTFYKINILK